MHRFSVAPMMDWTDRHCRVFHRVLSRQALLYTEMVTADAIIHGNRGKLLVSTRWNTPSRYNWVAAIRRNLPKPLGSEQTLAMMKSISMSDVLRIASRAATSARA